MGVIGEYSRPNIVGNFHYWASDRVQSAWNFNHGVVASERLEFIRRCYERQFSEFGDFGGALLREANGCVEARADGGAAQRQHVQSGEGVFDAVNAEIYLRAVSAELLT